MQKRVAARLRALTLVVLGLVSCVAAAKADTIDWGTAPGPNLLTTTDVNRPATNPTGVTVTSSATSTGATGQNVTIINGTAPPLGSLYGGVVRFQMTPPNTTANSSVMSMTMNFSQPVYNVSFLVNDIDGGPTFNDGANRFNDFVFASANGGTVLPTSVNLTNPGYLEYDATLGRVRTIQTLNFSTITTDGDARFNFTGPITSITITYRNGASAGPATNQWVFLDDITFQRAPQLRLAKSTSVGTGTFTFNTSNSGTGVTATNVTAGITAVNSPFVTLNALNTATTVTETGPAGWIINNGNVTCADSNSAVSGNPATFNGVVTTNNTVTVPAANIRGSAIITCTVVNQRRPTVQIVKISQGATGTFNFTGTNGIPGSTIPTSATNTATPGAVTTLTNAATATTITETALAGWEINGTPTCTVNGAAQTITWAVATRTLTLIAAQTAAGNAIVCTFTNRRLPRVTVRKTTLGGLGGPFTFTQTGLAAIANITTTAANTATASTSGAIVGTVGGATTLTEGAMPAATWRFVDASCTDANSALSGNPATVGTVVGQTITLTAAMVAGADILCTFRNGVIPTVAVRKTTLGNTAASPNFTFTQTNLSANPAAVSTTAHNTPSAFTATVTVTNNANPVTITEAVAAGYYFGSANCVDANSATSGNPAGAAAFGATTGNQLTIPAANLPYGAQVRCTFINNVIPTIRVRKITVGGVGGPFTFTQSNLAANPSNVTTTTAGVATAGTPATVNVSAIGTAITVTEGAFTGYTPASVSCTDNNAAITGNTGTFGTLAGSVLTIANTAVVGGAQFICTFTNEKLPTLTIRKTSVGNVGGFTFTGDNGFPSTTITTTASGTQVAGPQRLLATKLTATNITETAVPGYVMSLTSCTGLTGAATATLAGTTIQIPAAGTDVGANIVCNVLNQKTPTVLVRKTTVGGVGGPYTFTSSNITGTITGITTAVAGTPVATSSGALPITTQAAAVTLTEAPASGYFLSGASCTDSNAANSGNPTGTFGAVAGNALTIPNARTVWGAELVCTFTNTLANPQLQLTKTASPPGPKNRNDVVTYTFTVVNTGNVPISNVQAIETAFNGYGTAPVPGNEVIVTDVAPLGDSTDGGVNGTWTTLGPGDTIRFTATYNVEQGDIDFNQ
jgi:hypothetical protein